jgi:hypothetical protein
MKLLANSKYLRRKVGMALAAGCNRIEVLSKTEIIFHGHSSVLADIHTVEQSNATDFNPIVWAQMYSFLKDIPEQPVTVEISWESVEIYCVAIFRVPSWFEKEKAKEQPQ